jgi:hypothetical protein
VSASLNPPNLIAGDTMTITQLTPSAILGGHYLKIERAAVKTNVSLSDGMTSAVNAALVAVPQNQSQDVDLHLAEFESAVLVNGASILDASFGILPVPGPANAPDGIYAGSLPRFVVYTPPPAGQNFVGTFVWGDPFTEPHATLGRLAIDVGANWQFAGAASPPNPVMTVTYFDLASNFGTAVTPPFGPPTNVTVDLLPFATSTRISNQPKLEWSAPMPGSPDRYEIFVDTLGTNGTTTTVKPYATYFTTKTSLTLPPLPSGSYGFGLVAQKSPGVDFNANPRVRTTPFYQIGVLSGVLVVP